MFNRNTLIYVYASAVLGFALLTQFADIVNAMTDASGPAQFYVLVMTLAIIAFRGVAEGYLSRTMHTISYNTEAHLKHIASTRLPVATYVKILHSLRWLNLVRGLSAFAVILLLGLLNYKVAQYDYAHGQLVTAFVALQVLIYVGVIYFNAHDIKQAFALNDYFTQLEEIMLEEFEKQNKACEETLARCLEETPQPFNLAYSDETWMTVNAWFHANGYTRDGELGSRDIARLRRQNETLHVLFEVVPGEGLTVVAVRNGSTYMRSPAVFNLTTLDVDSFMLGLLKKLSEDA